MSRPTNQERNKIYKDKLQSKLLKYKMDLAYLHWYYLVPKKFRSPEVFGIILNSELKTV